LLHQALRRPHDPATGWVGTAIGSGDGLRHA
jgi:hypothetical protein